MRLARRAEWTVPPLDLPVVYEDGALLVVNKRPARGARRQRHQLRVIEQMRARGRSRSSSSSRTGSIAKPRDCSSLPRNARR